jgi:hypothetical protein
MISIYPKYGSVHVAKLYIGLIAFLVFLSFYVNYKSGNTLTTKVAML